MPAELSVVVPAVNTLGDLIGCLTALDAQSDAEVEVLVVDRLGDGVRMELARRFPRARHLRGLGPDRGCSLRLRRPTMQSRTRG